MAEPKADWTPGGALLGLGLLIGGVWSLASWSAAMVVAGTALMIWALVSHVLRNVE